jgi:hypothetical protein
MLMWETGDSGSEAQSNPSSLTRIHVRVALAAVSQNVFMTYCSAEREVVQYPNAALAKQRTGSRWGWM